MANTITSSYQVYSPKETVLYLTLSSDGTEETATVIYDSSAVATEIAKVYPGFTDPLTSRIYEIYASCNAAATARVTLLWDASTDVLAFNIPAATNASKGNFKRHGGLKNTAGTGITGDILLTTTGLESGDSIILVLTIGAH